MKNPAVTCGWNGQRVVVRWGDGWNFFSGLWKNVLCFAERLCFTCPHTSVYNVTLALTVPVSAVSQHES